MANSMISSIEGQQLSGFRRKNANLRGYCSISSLNYNNASKSDRGFRSIKNILIRRHEKHAVVEAHGQTLVKVELHISNARILIT